jgi:microcystin-dependent protein
MAEPFIGEIRLLGFTYAPVHWAECKGQVMDINQNATLYSLLGNQFGGDGRSTFQLPDMRGRAPVHAGNGVVQGLSQGLEAVNMAPAQSPAHTHTFEASNSPGQKAQIGFAGKRYLAQPEDGLNTPIYGAANNLVKLAEEGMGSMGAGRAHDNLQPSIVIKYAIALTGLYPSRN